MSQSQIVTTHSFRVPQVLKWERRTVFLVARDCMAGVNLEDIQNSLPVVYNKASSDKSTIGLIVITESNSLNDSDFQKIQEILGVHSNKTINLLSFKLSDSQVRELEKDQIKVNNL